MTSAAATKKDLSTLIIGEDNTVLASVLPALEKLQHRLVLASTPSQGLEHFHSASPDLVILDIDLASDDAGLSKFDAIQELLSQAPELPLIVLTRTNNSDDLLRALRLGVSDFLLLPLENLEILDHSISTCLRRARLLGENNRIRRKLVKANAELQVQLETFREDQKAGRQVQKNMMPSPPKTLGGFIFDHKVAPSLYMSGDTVDYQSASRHETLFYIADVSGHGSSSAFITFLLRFRIEQIRIEHLRGRSEGELSPAHILSVMNHDLLKSDLGKHVTVFMGVLNDETNTLVYSVAGHHPLPVLYQNGKAATIPLARSSLPIGLFGEAPYFNQSLAIADDFALALFSDGILEVLPQADTASKEQRLIEVMEQTKGKFEVMKETLFPPKTQSLPDDIAVMSITRLAASDLAGR